MKRTLLGLFILAAMSSGCASYYSGIRQVSGNTYFVTRVRQGLFSVNSDLLRCEANGAAMNCTQISEP